MTPGQVYQSVVQECDVVHVCGVLVTGDRETRAGRQEHRVGTTSLGGGQQLSSPSDRGVAQAARVDNCQLYKNATH